jgi:ABC-type lipoprotein export system ATPase subunit
MISLQAVSKTYPAGRGQPVRAVREVSLAIGPGEFLVVVGRSGSGKTTLLNLAAGLTRPTGGRVRLDGTDLWTLSDAQQSALRARHFGFAFQFPSLLPALTARENVLLPAVFGRPGAADRAAEQRRAGELLARVGLAEKLEARPRELSAGQQQRVVIARALMNQPRVLLADEPTSNLDEKTEQEILELFRELHQSLGLTIVMVTHMRQLMAHGTRAIEMAEGQIVVEHAAQPAA